MHFVLDIQERQEEGEQVDHEIQIFKNALDFSDVKARECMVHRTEMVAMNVEDSIEELKAKFIETGLSKILIYRDSIDNIIGYTHSLEMFKKPEYIKSVLLPVAIIDKTSNSRSVNGFTRSSLTSLALRDMATSGRGASASVASFCCSKSISDTCCRN